VVTTSQRRELVAAFVEVGVSERKATEEVGIARSTQRYESRRTDDPELRAQIIDLAAARRRFGYRRITWLVQQDGKHVNHKRVYRIYCEENLQVRKRSRKKVRLFRKPLAPAARPHERWSMDFVSDSLATGRRYRTLNVVDNCTRECLAIEIDFSLTGHRVARVLDRLVWCYGKPERIVLDNGPEFTSKSVLSWSTRNNVFLDFISPGKPMENAFCESFNGKFRDECLNEHWFVDIQDARHVIEEWRVDFNTARPHSALGNLTPTEFANSFMQAVSA
jgi:putative transposase